MLRSSLHQISDKLFGNFKFHDFAAELVREKVILLCLPQPESNDFSQQIKISITIWIQSPGFQY